MIRLDRTLSDSRLSRLEFLYGGGTEGARSVLSTIAGSMITISGVVFSITIVALALASSQFGPRLLRSFIRDRGNQVVLGMFIATFLYCLLVLRVVVSPEDGDRFVPHVAVTMGMVLAVGSISVLIYFIHHIAVAIQADTVVATVGREFVESVDRLFPSPAGEPTDSPHSELPDHLGSEPAIIASVESGYVQVIDTDALVEIASNRDLLIELQRRPGDFVIKGAAFARVWPGERVSEQVESQIRESTVLGPYRTQEQDVEFPVNQLAEIAVRALSPGINDPFTAMACVDRLGAGLCRLAEREFPPRVLKDSRGNARLVVDAPSFADVADTAFNQIRQHARASAAVTIRLLETIREIASFARQEEQREALLRHADMVERGSRNGLSEENDRRAVAQAHREAIVALAPRRFLDEG